MLEKDRSPSPSELSGFCELGVTKGLPEINEDSERKAVRRIDYTVIPVISMYYLLAFLDRTNIANARLAGLQSSLELTEAQYRICITVLFIPYVLGELPSNLILRKVGPGILMPVLITIWGVIVTFQGFVSSFAGLAIARVLLGLAEGPIGPCIVCYLSGFYTRRELSLRIALFFSTASLSEVFSGLLAAAIRNMDGIGGRPGWAWIFILEGSFTICMGVVGFFLIPSTPRDSRFLTYEQKELIMARLERDRPSIRPADKFSGREVLQSIRSPQVIILFIVLFMKGAALNGMASFLPSVVNGLGFSPSQTPLFTAGPFAVGFFVTVVSSYLSDRYQSRGIAIALTTFLAIAGCFMFLAANNKFAAYGALYLLVPGIYGTTPILSAWMANNSEPYYRRATSISVGFMSLNSGAFLNTWSFHKKEGPKHRRTMFLFLIFSICVVFGSLANIAYLSWKNKSKRRTGRREELLEKYEKDEDGGLRAWMDLGDEHPDFQYTL